jgi:hypothetical protein
MARRSSPTRGWKRLISADSGPARRFTRARISRSTPSASANEAGCVGGKAFGKVDQVEADLEVRLDEFNGDPVVGSRTIMARHRRFLPTFTGASTCPGIVISLMWPAIGDQYCSLNTCCSAHRILWGGQSCLQPAFSRPAAWKAALARIGRPTKAFRFTHKRLGRGRRTGR